MPAGICSGIQVCLWLVRVGVSVVTRADVLPVDDLPGVLREVAGVEIAATIDALDLTSFKASGSGIAANFKDWVEMFEGAYQELAKFVEEEEKKIMETRTAVGRDLSRGSANAGKRSYEKDMVFEVRSRGGADGEVEHAWVRRSNVTAWKEWIPPVQQQLLPSTP